MLRKWFRSWKARRAQRKLLFPQMRWTRQGALLVPTAEWQGIDIDDGQKNEWMKQFEPPTLPTVVPPKSPRYPSSPTPGSLACSGWEH